MRSERRCYHRAGLQQVYRCVVAAVAVAAVVVIEAWPGAAAVVADVGVEAVDAVVIDEGY